MTTHVVRTLCVGTALIFAVAGGLSSVKAESLRVSPVKIAVSAPAKAAALTVRNDKERPVGIQVRVFRSVMQGGRERLTPTTDVVADPPLVTLEGNSKTRIHIVRVAVGPVEEDERYRLVVDQMPTSRSRDSNGGHFLIRHVISVDFQSPLASWRLDPDSDADAEASTVGQRVARSGILDEPDEAPAVR